MSRLWAAPLALAAVAAVHYPESIPQCTHPTTDDRRVALVHLGGCRKPTKHVKGITGGVTTPTGGWSVALVTDDGIRRLRRRGCPTAVICADSNDYSALVESVSQEELGRLIDAAKLRAKPKLRPGVDGGPVVWPDP